jgi:nitroreductase/dihydropteridine reductase|tara:strand:- start:144440 stop:145111 length:672 start_codon:yes stop_codon:yes gene_type:complete
MSIKNNKKPNNKNMDLLDKLNWRYAAKAMNGEKVAEDKIERILEATRLAPTSSGLQPFEVMVIKNQDIKEQIRPVAWNQSVVTDCSHLLVFAAWDTYTPERINYMFDLTNDIRGFKNEGWENYRQMLLDSYPQKDEQENFEHAARQAYIAFSHAIIAAAYENVDATPLEGFDATEVDKILGLREKGLRSAVLLPLGYRKEDEDWLVNLVKVRKPMEDMVTVIE